MTRKIKVLIVEDDRINQMVLSKMLELRGITTVCVSDGFEAVKYFSEHDDLDIVLMDIQLPGMDGIETTAKMRKIEENKVKRTPIVALTAYFSTGNESEFLSQDFDDHAVKPVDYEFLIRLIKKHTIAS
ncbi:MAG TPA: response regulator [bacterium]|nr:response regulator [bacterium]